MLGTALRIRDTPGPPPAGTDDIMATGTARPWSGLRAATAARHGARAGARLARLAHQLAAGMLTQAELQGAARPPPLKGPSKPDGLVIV